MLCVMKKKEIIILAVIALLAVVAIVALNMPKNVSKTSETKGVMVAIYHRNKIVQEFDSGIDAVYTIEGDYGTLDVEVKDGKWRVTNEECPNHICAEMGWIGEGEYLPITCLPNNVVVVEETPAS